MRIEELLVSNEWRKNDTDVRSNSVSMLPTVVVEQEKQYCRYTYCGRESAVRQRFGRVLRLGQT